MNAAPIHYLLNCFLLFIPVFIWNMVFFKKLSISYQKAIWDKIPKSIKITENTLRIGTFIIPLIFSLNFNSSIEYLGLFIYCIGLIGYFLSWILQIKYTESKWSKSLFGFMAPAYSSFVWLLGIDLIGKETTVDIPCISDIYFVIIFFVAVHSFHAYLVYKTRAPIT